MNVKVNHLAPFKLAPATPPGTCPECAIAHAPTEPHNQQSLAYQYKFYGSNGRWPTWKDAMSHCSEQVKKQWADQLAKHGVTV